MSAFEVILLSSPIQATRLGIYLRWCQVWSWQWAAGLDNDKVLHRQFSPFTFVDKEHADAAVLMYTDNADTGFIDRLFSRVKALDRFQQQKIEAQSPQIIPCNVDGSEALSDVWLVSEPALYSNRRVRLCNKHRYRALKWMNRLWTVSADEWGCDDKSTAINSTTVIAIEGISIYVDDFSYTHNLVWPRVQFAFQAGTDPYPIFSPCKPLFSIHTQVFSSMLPSMFLE